MVWLLFESGLRGDPLARVVNDITKTKKPNANLAAKKLLESKTDYLLIVRKPRGPKTLRDKPEQMVKAIKQSELAGAILQEPTAADLLIIPVGPKFDDIRKRTEILF